RCGEAARSTHVWSLSSGRPVAAGRLPALLDALFFASDRLEAAAFDEEGRLYWSAASADPSAWVRLDPADVPGDPVGHPVLTRTCAAPTGRGTVLGQNGGGPILEWSLLRREPPR